MRIKKNYTVIFFLTEVIFLSGCRPLTVYNKDADLSLEPVYSNYFIITSPERYSFWNPGEMMEIKWITSGSVSDVDIELYRKSELKFELKNNLSNNGSFHWLIPNNIDRSLHYQIKIINHDNYDEYELSERFAIED